MAPPLRLLLLGPPLLVTAAGEQLQLRTRKHFALLIRLAVEAGKRFTRDYLMELLWPAAAAPLARHSLAQALTVVRDAVGREHLLVQRATVALAASGVEVDLQHLAGCDVPVRGPFLDGFEVPGAVAFEQWKDEWRAKLQPRIRDCLVKQMDAGRRVGDFATVERHAQVLYELDPLAEEGVRGLMEARAWVGDRSNALKVYARFAAALAEELGAKPSPELARIAGLLREGRRAAPRPAAPAAVAERQEKRFEAEPLIGREAEFATLYDAWLEVRGRTPRIVVVTGEPGVGKTTLTNAFVSTCQMEGAVVARAQAYAAERELPFAVLAELIKQLTLQRAIGGAAPEALSELARVAPEILQAFPGVPRPLEWAAEVIPLRLADAVLKALEAAAEESPVVLVSDDLHAADNASVAIMHVVARKLAQSRVLLILTGRTHELRTVAASALVSDHAIRALQWLELEPLGADAAERLVRTVAAGAGGGGGGGRSGEVPTARILQASNGNPLALELLTKEWVAHGARSLLSDLEAVNTQPAARVGIPRAIAAVFERQVPRLERAARAALDLAAVLGRRLADLPLYEVVGLSPPAAGEALSRLLEEGFLREIRWGLEFRNELIRVQAYYAIAAPARQHLHRKIAEQLATRRAEDGPSLSLEIAWHFLRADDALAATAHAIAGAEAALKVGAPYEAESVLSAISRQPMATSSQLRAHLLLAKALLDQSKAEVALPILDHLVREPTLSLRDTAEITRMQATAICLANRDDGQNYVEAADKAVRTARLVGDVDLVARAVFEHARSGVEAGDEPRVRAALREIDDLLTDPTGARLPSLHYAEGFCHFFLFDPGAAARSLETAKDLLISGRNVTELSHAYNGYGNSKYHLCEFGAAREAYLAGLAVAQRVGDDSRASIITSNLCSLLTTTGDYKGAVQFGLQSIRLGTRALNQPILWIPFGSLAEAHMLAGDRTSATECLERARELVRTSPSWSANVQLLCYAADVALVTGNLDLALGLIRAAEDAASGKEQFVPSPGVFEKLRIFRAAHISGPTIALELADAAKAMFHGRHPLHYLTVLAATAWAEKRAFGTPRAGTARELEAFNKPALAGLRAWETAEGFLGVTQS